MKEKSVFRTVEPYLYLLPALILFALFVFWPFIRTIQLSFARTTPLGQVAQYTGLENYINIFKGGIFINSLIVSAKFSILNVIFSIALGFILAIISTEKIRGKGFFRTLYALAAVTVVSVWMNIGLNFIYLTAAIQSVPAELYESVGLDGANFFQKHWHVTVPGVSPTLFFLLIIHENQQKNDGTVNRRSPAGIRSMYGTGSRGQNCTYLLACYGRD